MQVVDRLSMRFRPYQQSMLPMVETACLCNMAAAGMSTMLACLPRFKDCSNSSLDVESWPGKGHGAKERFIDYSVLCLAVLSYL